MTSSLHLSIINLEFSCMEIAPQLKIENRELENGAGGDLC